MKHRISSRLWQGLIFILSLGITVAGIALAIRSFRIYEQMVLSFGPHDDILVHLRRTAGQLLLFGGMAVSGLSAMVVLMMRIADRSRREVAALEAKNAAMEELHRKTKELAHHQRLELLGTMTSSIAHEFNNLLAPIMGYSMMTLEKLPPEETELYDNVLEIYNASRKAKVIISRLSDLSRKNSSDTFHQVSPDELVRRALDMVEPSRPKGVEIKLSLNCWDRKILANEIQISQLLLNLFLNSFHAMGASGILAVDTWFDEDSIFLRVSDTGCGIPEAVMPHIFEPFFTTKGSDKGTGLGLAIAAQVVEDHHGSIDAASTPGEGTSFTVTLPRSAQHFQE